MRKKFLEKKLARLEEKRKALNARAQASTDAAEVRGLIAELSELAEEIELTKEELTSYDEDDGGVRSKPANVERVNANAASLVLGSYVQQTPSAETQRAGENVLASMEYRTAFKNYVQRGTPVPAELLKRAGGDPGTTITQDIGLTVPQTIMDEFIRKFPEKSYGRLFAKTRKLQLKGGVEFPIADLKAAFKWISETTVSPEQKAGDINESVKFSYNIGEIRVAQSLLSSIEALDTFEDKIVEIMLEAYAEAMEKGMFTGTGSGQPLGIFNDPRITNVVEFTEAEFNDWRQWHKKLLAKVPTKLYKNGEFVFPHTTVESNLLTMEDGLGRPVYTETTGAELKDDRSEGRFCKRAVNIVEADIIGDFDEANAGDIVGAFIIPGEYAVNTPYQFGVKRYFDENTNKWITKGLTVTDGKALDANMFYIIKKKAG